MRHILQKTSSCFTGGPGKRCQRPGVGSPVLYPLCKCAEIKRNASEKRELQGNRELAGWLPTRISSDGQMPVSCVPTPPPASESSTEVGGGTPIRACYRDRQSWTSLGADRASFYLLLSFGNCSLSSPFRALGQITLGPWGDFLLRPNFNCVYPQSSTFSVQELEKTPE